MGPGVIHSSLALPAEAALLPSAELFFATYRHAVLPLHAALVTAICSAKTVPLELATVLEDIGQAYIGFAAQVNAELIARGVADRDPDPDDVAEARIDQFVRSAVARLGQVKLRDGGSIDGRQAIEAFPAVADAMRTALVVALAARQHPVG